MEFGQNLLSALERELSHSHSSRMEAESIRFVYKKTALCETHLLAPLNQYRAMPRFPR